MQTPPSVLRPSSLDQLATKKQLDEAGVKLMPAAVFCGGGRPEKPLASEKSMIEATHAALSSVAPKR